MTVNVAGVLIVVICGALGAGAMVAAPSIGISEANAIPFGLLVGGVLASLASWHQSISGNPNSIFFPVWMYGTAAAIFGVLGMIGLVSFTDEPPMSKDQARKLEQISENLRKNPSSGANKKGLEYAQRFQGTVALNARNLGGGDKASVYVDAGIEGEKTRVVSMFVRVEQAGRMKEDSLKSLLSVCMKLLQTDFPQYACNVAIRAPEGWVAHSRAKGPNMPGVHEITGDPPNF